MSFDLPELQRLHTRVDAKAILNVSLRTINLWIDAGVLPLERYHGFERVISDAALRRFGSADDVQRVESCWQRPLVLLVSASSARLDQWGQALGGFQDQLECWRHTSVSKALVDIGTSRPKYLIADAQLFDGTTTELLRALSASRRAAAPRGLVVCRDAKLQANLLRPFSYVHAIEESQGPDGVAKWMSGAFRPRKNP